MVSEHIVKSYDTELELLKRTLVQMGGVAESQVELAIQCVARRDASLASRVIENDVRLDQYEREIDQITLRLLALRQPMAQDLRETLAALKIASDLERIGDYAANVAKRAITLSQVPAVKPISSIPRMGRMVQEIIKDVLDAYTQKDVQKALDAWERDEEVDDLYTSIFREILTYMMEDPRNITPCTHLLFIAKNLERIGDHATNVAEIIHFLVEGRMIKEERPKGDISSFAVVEPDDGGEETTDDEGEDEKG